MVKRYEVAFAFAHLLALDVDVSVAVVGFGPEFLVLPDGCVVEEGHRQVVFDQVLPRTSQVQGVPVQERLPAFVQLVLRYFGTGVFLSQENMTPKIMSKIFNSNSKSPRHTSQNIPLQHMHNSIKSKVNSTIRQRLNKILLIKRQFSSKSKRSRTSPFLQPIDGVDKFIMQCLVITFEIFLYVVEHPFLPIFICIV